MEIKTGVDIIRVNRIEKILAGKREKFYQRIFTSYEVEYFKEKNHDPKTVAGIFASKEAVSKIFGLGIGFLNWKDIEVLHDEKGKPYINLSQESLEKYSDLKYYKIDISISHEDEYAVAFGIGYIVK